jgi:hypothetical protein
MLERYQYAMLLNVVIIMLVFRIKPSFLFNELGDIKEFGYIEDNKSILSVYIFFPIISIFLYILVLAFDAICRY